jgi:hypothetical protein
MLLPLTLTSPLLQPAASLLDQRRVFQKLIYFFHPWFPQIFDVLCQSAVPQTWLPMPKLDHAVSLISSFLQTQPQQEKLHFNVFTTDGAVPIDNNVSEREMKRVVLNRKNSLFVGNPRGGRTAAILASLTSSCRRRDLDPQLYFMQLLVNR